MSCWRTLWLLGALVACAGDRDGGIDPSGDDDDTSPSEVALITAPPVLEMNDNPAAPLIGTLAVETSEPTTLLVEATSGDYGFSLSFDGAATRHDVVLMGFRPDSTWDVTVTVTGDSGQDTWDPPLTATTPPLPADFPDLAWVATDQARVEPGFTLFHVDVVPSSAPEYLVLVDNQARPIWYYATGGAVNHVLQLKNGNMMFMPERWEIREVDLFGDVVRSFKSSIAPDLEPGDIEVDTLVFHHDVIEKGDGNLLALGMELVQVPDYPTSEEVPGPGAPAQVVYDTLVEFDGSGAVVKRRSLREILDPLRIGYESVTGNWWTSFVGTDARDWGHANSVVYQPETESLLVSLRHQDAVVSIDDTTGALRWILAPQPNWRPDLLPYVLEPTGAGYRQHYHQHAANFGPDGTITMFDNGNYQASAYETAVPPSQIDSRAVEYRIDDVAGTVEQVWAWDALGEPNFSPGLGNVQILPETGNVLVTYGAAGGGNGYDARVVEIDKPSGDVVFDFAVRSPSGRICRAVKLPTPYADGTRIERLVTR